jgi:hypothetical protein
MLELQPKPEFALYLGPAGYGLTDAEVAYKAVSEYWDHVTSPERDRRDMSRVVQHLFNLGIKDLHNELIDARATGESTVVLLSKEQCGWLNEALSYVSDQNADELPDLHAIRIARELRNQISPK